MSKNQIFLSSSIKTRLAIVFASTVLIIGIIYTGFVMFAIMETESQLMSSTLESMLDETVKDDMAHGKPPRLDPFSKIYVEDDSERNIPQRFMDAPDGYSEYIGDEELHIFSKRIEGKRYILTRSQDEFEQWERHLFIRGIILLLIVANLALGVGYLTSRLFFRPLDHLMSETRRMNHELAKGRVSTNFFTGEWQNNEIGELAKSFQMTTSRLHELLMSEREFVSAISHELRTPLTVMTTSIELLEDSNRLGQYERNILKRAQRTTARMNDLLEVFLSIVRDHNIQTGRESTVSEVFDEMSVIWEQDTFVKGLTFEVIKKEHTVLDSFNFVLASVVFNNLVANAIRYTDKGLVRVVLGQDYFSVFDSGAGISIQEKERVFDQGYRGNNVQGKVGHGLGLSIASRACARLGWRIVLDKNESVGTTFMVLFKQNDLAQ